MKDKYSHIKIAWFPNKLDALKNNIVTPPVSSLINPTNRCNHGCYFCVYNANYSGMHDGMQLRDELSIEKLYEILDDFKEMGVKAVTYSGGGEPLLHPHASDYIKRTLDNRLDLSMITNGQLLHKENADLLLSAKWVRISMDYYNVAGFQKSGRGNEKMYINIINNITNFAKLKNKNCDLTANWVITKDNYKDLYAGAKFLKDIGIENVKFSAVWVKNLLDYHSSIEAYVKYELNRIKKDLEDDNFKIYENYNITVNENVTNRSYEKCYFMQVVTNIGADGNVYNCHNKGYDKTGMVGSIKNQSFKEMWFSEDTAKYFNTFNAKKMCNHQCAPDSKNIFIHSLMNSIDDNYI